MERDGTHLKLFSKLGVNVFKATKERLLENHDHNIYVSASKPFK
jgi:hypothetical protein